MANKRKATPVDIQVGVNLRERRMKLKLSQQQLAKQLDISPQQLQKYEVGMNRISASMLWDISKVLKVPVQTLYKDVP